MSYFLLLSSCFPISLLLCALREIMYWALSFVPKDLKYPVRHRHTPEGASGQGQKITEPSALVDCGRWAVQVLVQATGTQQYLSVLLRVTFSL